MARKTRAAQATRALMPTLYNDLSPEKKSE